MDNPGASQRRPDRQVFVSYGHIDDELPPGTQANGKGFVTYLVGQLGYELQQLGLARGIAWLDRYKLRSGDDWVQIIAEELAKSDILLAIVSNNFLQSEYCRDEVSLFQENIKGNNARRRIFRVDKQQVANDLLPPELRNVQAVPFFARDRESGTTVELYWRGRPTRKKELELAIKKLADDIFARLMELNNIIVTPPPAPPPPATTPVRTVFVAKPAFDLADPYQTVVRELQGRNIRVLPDPAREIPTDDGNAALALIRDALAKSDASVHLIGERAGIMPDGLEQRIVPLQLAEARAVAARNGRFQRLIWVPTVMPGSDGSAAERDPVAVVEQFDGQTDNDQIFGDTAARFTDYLLQRLLPKASPPPPLPGRLPPQRPPSVYVAASPADRDFAVRAARDIKALGIKPTIALLNGELKVAPAFDHIVLCWGAADETDMMDVLDSASRQLAARPNPQGKVCLLVYPPDSDSKHLAIEVESFGSADLIIDARRPLQSADVAPLLGQGS